MGIATADLDLIKTFLEDEKQALIDSQILRGLRASGQSAALLRTAELTTGGQLIDGSGSFEFQEFGRGPTNAGNLGGDSLRSRIYQWLEFKKYGLNWSNDKQRNAIAWAIANKIHRRGTYTYIKGKQTGVLSDNINDRRIDALVVKFAGKYSNQITSDISGLFKRN